MALTKEDLEEISKLIDKALEPFMENIIGIINGTKEIKNKVEQNIEGLKSEFEEKIKNLKSKFE